MLKHTKMNNKAFVVLLLLFALFYLSLGVETSENHNNLDVDGEAKQLGEVKHRCGYGCCRWGSHNSGRYCQGCCTTAEEARLNQNADKVEESQNPANDEQDSGSGGGQKGGGGGGGQKGGGGGGGGKGGGGGGGKGGGSGGGGGGGGIRANEKEATPQNLNGAGESEDKHGGYGTDHHGGRHRGGGRCCEN